MSEVHFEGIAISPDMLVEGDAFAETMARFIEDGYEPDPATIMLQLLTRGSVEQKLGLLGMAGMLSYDLQEISDSCVSGPLQPDPHSYRLHEGAIHAKLGTVVGLQRFLANPQLSEVWDIKVEKYDLEDNFNGTDFVLPIPTDDLEQIQPIPRDKIFSEIELVKQMHSLFWNIPKIALII